MNSDASAVKAGSPAELYMGRLKNLNDRQAAEQRRARTLGFAKLSVAIATIVLGVALLHHPTELASLLSLVAAFFVLAILQEKLLRAVRDRSRAIDFYERGLARLSGRWPGTGQTGARFLKEVHPYARDLDIFGDASIFELLCTARTRAGEETLAHWLLAAAAVDQVLARQGAVAELTPRVSFREELWSVGETVRLGVQPEALARWGESATRFGSTSVRVLTSLLALLWVGSLVCWAVWGVRSFALLMTVVNLGYSHRLHSRQEEATDQVEAATKDLGLLAGILSLIEEASFESAKLREAQAALQRTGVLPSRTVRELRRIVEWLESRRNPFAQLLNVFTFWSAQLVFLSERWQRRFGPEIRGWLKAVGEIEALAALSGYAYEHPADIFPEFLASGRLFAAEAFAHPLLPAEDTVRNDLQLGGGTDLIILSGPNMAGKSTFMRSIGVNIVLAQCGAPVRARSMRLSPLAVAASICTLDSLQGGISRFYAEINRIKLISDLAQGPLPVLFLLDELLSGTNSHDRLIGTQYVVGSLLDQGATGIVSTHDLALAQIPETLGPRAINCHFEDRLEDGKLIFDYKLKAGIVETSNALELMRSIGLGVAR